MSKLLQDSAFFCLAISLIGYEIGIILRQKTKLALCNPLLISIVFIIIILKVTNIKYEVYEDGSQLLSYLLTPSTVCLAIPLYQHIEKLNEEQLVTFRRDHVGFIFQSFHLMGTLNAVENVALPLSFRGVPRDVRVRKANEMLDLVKLGKHKKHLPNQMSGGQQQRVGVARALVVDPDIIFADEPTGNLDSHTSEEVMELMQRVVREQKKTLVMVTHDDHLATYADRVFHIRDGRIIKIEDNRWKKGKEEGGRHAETNTERDRK